MPRTDDRGAGMPGRGANGTDRAAGMAGGLGAGGPDHGAGTASRSAAGAGRGAGVPGAADTLAAVSPLLTAPRRDTSGPPGATHRTRGTFKRITADQAFGAALAAGLALLVFTTRGGSALAPSTWSQIVLLALGAIVAVGLVIAGAPGRAWGAATAVCFAAVVALTAISISWSVQPDNSWQAADQALSYLAVFTAAAALARMAPGRWRGVVGAIATVSTVVAGYALLEKVFIASLDPGDPYGRLLGPFDYWNATGVIAALGLPACLWAGARREGGRASRALAVPAIGVLVSVTVLSYSRGALAAAVVGVGLWFAFVPSRLRAALVLALGCVGGATVALWALATHPLTRDYQPTASKITAGHHFGVVLIIVLAIQTLAGFAAAFGMERVEVSERVRRRIGTALVVLVALLPVAGFGALANSSRGLTGEISHIWHTVTNPNAVVNNGAGRLENLGSTRAHYWSEAITVGEHALLKGVGAAGFRTARTRYASDSLPVDAHGYVPETFADFGLIGLALNLALLVAWCISAGRTVGVRHGLRAPADRAAEHAGMLTLLAVTIIFGLSSAVDWTWLVPGTAVPALVCAGWLAGRGPLTQTTGRLSHRRRMTASPGAGFAVTAIVALAVLAAWVVWQPLRSQDALAAAEAQSGSNTTAAIAHARAAAADDPLSYEPQLLLSAIYRSAGDPAAARQELLRAVALQPANSVTWFALGEFDLQARRPRSGLAELQRGLALDPSSTEGESDIARAYVELLATAKLISSPREG